FCLRTLGSSEHADKELAMTQTVTSDRQRKESPTAKPPKTLSKILFTNEPIRSLVRYVCARHARAYTKSPWKPSLAPNNVRRMNTLGCIPRIDDEFCLVYDRSIVILRVIRQDDDAIEFGYLVERRAFHIERIFASLPD